MNHTAMHGNDKLQGLLIYAGKCQTPKASVGQSQID
jgi:hypothetical protein